MSNLPLLKPQSIRRARKFTLMMKKWALNKFNLTLMMWMITRITLKMVKIFPLVTRKSNLNYKSRITLVKTPNPQSTLTPPKKSHPKKPQEI